MTIDLGNTHQNVNVVLTDLSGKRLKNDELNGVSKIDFELDQPAGMYLLNLIIDGGNSITKPLMVK